MPDMSNQCHDPDDDDRGAIRTELSATLAAVVCSRGCKVILSINRLFERPPSNQLLFHLRVFGIRTMIVKNVKQTPKVIEYVTRTKQTLSKIYREMGDNIPICDTQELQARKLHQYIPYCVMLK